MSYEASNPGNVRIQYLHLLLYDQLSIGFTLVLLLIGGVVAVFHLYAGLIVMGLGVVSTFQSLGTAKQCLEPGDVLPALVIDPKRKFVATMANMQKPRETMRSLSRSSNCRCPDCRATSSKRERG